MQFSSFFFLHTHRTHGSPSLLNGIVLFVKYLYTFLEFDIAAPQLVDTIIYLRCIQ